MKNTYVIGDIHGGLRALQQVLSRTPLTPNDHLIFLGDYVDGWSDTPALIDFLIDLENQYQCTFLMGNHEEMVLRWLQQNDDNELWRQHGGQNTVDVYEQISDDLKLKHIAFLEKLKPYYIDSNNNLFVHAGFTNQKGVKYEYFQGMFWWDRTLWECAMALEKNLAKTDVRYPKRLLLYNEIFIGHTPTIRMGSDVPMHFANVWNVDTGAAFTGKVTIMNVATKAYIQSDALPLLYPDERGRNK